MVPLCMLGIEVYKPESGIAGTGISRLGNKKEGDLENRESGKLIINDWGLKKSQ